MHSHLLDMFTPACVLIALTSQNAFVSVYKTAGCQVSLCVTVWPMTHDVTNTFIFTVMPANLRAHLSQEVIHSNYPLENDSLFVVNIVNVVGFMWGFPNVLIMNTFVLILDRICLEGTWKDLISVSMFPPPFTAIFCLTCLSKSMWIQQASLLLVWTVSDTIVQGRNPQIPTDRHKQAPCLPCSPNNCLLWWWHVQWMRRTRKRTRCTKTLSIETPSKVSRAETKMTSCFLSACCTPLRPAFLEAHLRKTSVPPHDAEPCVSICL